MLRYLAILIGCFAIIAVLTARGQAPVQQPPIQTQAPLQEGLSTVGLVGGVVGGILLLVLIGSLIAWQWYKTPQAKDDDKALEELRIIYGFWLIVAVLLIALVVFVVTLAVLPTRQAADIVAIAGTVTGLITTLTAAFFGIQQAGAGRSQALTALAQSTRADGAVVGKLDPSYGPHAGGTKVTITGNGFTRANGVNFGATPGTDFKFVNDGIVIVNGPPARSKDNETKVYVVSKEPRWSKDWAFRS
jgi:heme/copper-type cytochrome/quinol oxidase subunit 2